MCFGLATWFSASSDEQSDSEELTFSELFSFTEFFGFAEFFGFTALFSLERFLFSLETLLETLRSLWFLLQLAKVKDEVSLFCIFFTDSRVTSRGC